MGERQDWGKEIESRALAWLMGAAKGGVRRRLLARNFRCKGGEIDLIFEESRATRCVELVFLEVRGRRPLGWVSGLESVVERKRRRIELAAALFLAQYRGVARSVRFDVLAWDGRDWLHVPNAWYGTRT